MALLINMVASSTGDLSTALPPLTEAKVDWAEAGIKAGALYARVTEALPLVLCALPQIEPFQADGDGW